MDFDSDRLLNLLEKETVTAWGAKEKDFDLFRQISPGDSFLMRTGKPAIVQYVQQIDYTLGGEAPRDLRAELSETIWGSDDYEYLWFSETPITEIELRQEEFESIIREAYEDFNFDDWFPSQSTNATRIDEEVLADLGGERTFLDRLEEYNGEDLQPGASHHFLFYEAHDAAGLTDDHFFEFKQTAVEHWSEVQDAENDGRAAVLDDEGCILGVGRVGNIEGELRDGSRYKKVNLIDWQPVSADSVTELLRDLGISSPQPLIDQSRPHLDPITLLPEDKFEAILKRVSEEQSTDLHTYWELTKTKREIADEFLEERTREELEHLLDPSHFFSQQRRMYQSDLDQIFDSNSASEIAETIETAIENDAPGQVTEVNGFGWAKATELLAAVEPDTYSILNERSETAMSVLGYEAPDSSTASPEEYQNFVEDVEEAVSGFGLRETAEDICTHELPDWATDLEVADFVFNAHYKGEYDLEEETTECPVTTEEAPYYWVNQKNNPAEIEEEYLRAPADENPNHDIGKLGTGDIVFNHVSGDIIGYSEVTESPQIETVDGEEYCHAEVSLTRFNDPLRLADVFSYLIHDDIQTETYYPLYDEGINQGYLFNLSQAAGEYLLEEAGVKSFETHPALDHHQKNSNVSVWRFSVTASDWLTILRRGAMHLWDANRDDGRFREQWRETSPGDLVLFHLKEEEDKVGDGVTVSDYGIFGVGIVDKKDTKSDRWWYDEDEALKYPYLIRFDEMYVTSDVEELDLETPVFALEDDEIISEFEPLIAGLLQWSDVSELAEESMGRDIPLQSGSYANLTATLNGVESFTSSVIQRLAPHLSEVSPPESFPGMLPLSEDEPDDAKKLANQLERNGQLVLYGPPGTGKTYTATRFARWWIHQQNNRPSDQRFQTVTFHPSYSYEDFMEGLTANATDENLVEYEYEDGTFKEVVKQARNGYLEAADRDSAPRYVLLIDEINRGNLSQIFGEAITQLEMDKRLDQDESVTVRWAHTGDPIDLPPNLYIIGTMNTADQSIAQVDAALRRRFAFVGCPPDYSVFVDEYEFDSETAIGSLANDVITSGREGVDAAEDHYPLLALSIRALKAINENILSSRDLNKGKQIGHSYLLDIKSTDDLVAAWQFDILPLLEEYYFGDFDRLRREVFEINVETSSETVIDSNLFELNEHKIADLEVDDLETTLGQFVDSHEFNEQ
ncbi:McrB family protein [Halostagnicola kamekurae]|nr:AAA family ATPase [Halostagnicola kamekurae]